MGESCSLPCHHRPRCPYDSLGFLWLSPPVRARVGGVARPAPVIFEPVIFRAMTYHEFWRRCFNLLCYMNNPWFKGEHAENVYFKRVYTLYLKVDNHYNYIPTEEDVQELLYLEAHKPAVPCPYSRATLYR